MVVNDLNLLWPSSSPQEANPPLVIDTDTMLTRAITMLTRAITMLTRAIALKRFETVPRRNPQFFEVLRVTELAQFPQRH